MKPESNQARDERAAQAALARAYREASNAADEPPDPRVRAAVLAAAARAVDAKPHDAARRAAAHPFATRRWPLSAAALLVVSIMTGLVVTRGWWERPDLVDANQQRQERVQERVQESAQEAARAPAPTAPAQDAPQPPAPSASVSNAPSDLAANPGTARSEPKAKLNDARRRTSGVASPKASGDEAREASATPAPDGADATASGMTAKKSEEFSSNAAAVAASAAASTAASTSTTASAAPAPAQRSLSRIAQLRGNLRADETTGTPAEPASPEAWIERIVKLREAGEDDQADREVARLKLRYPGFTIPREALRPIGTR